MQRPTKENRAKYKDYNQHRLSKTGTTIAALFQMKHSTLAKLILTQEKLKKNKSSYVIKNLMESFFADKT